MDKLKVCFIGVGSIARRHIRNLRDICGQRGVDLIIDAVRRDSISADGVDTIYTDDIPDRYDIIFITNPTSLHLSTLQKYHDKGKHFFIEKPVVSLSQIEEADSFKCRSDAVYYVACPLRYNAVIQWIKNNINSSEVLSVRSIASSYLPDWRPGQDYRKTYSAHKDMGGGVSIDLIHEWDYLTYLFGWPKHVKSFIGRKSDLEIESDDYAIYIAEFANMIAELHLDYFGRKTIREIQIITKNNTFIGNIAESRITELGSGKITDFGEERDNYQVRELEHFLDMVCGRTNTEDGFHHGLDVLKLTQGGQLNGN